MTKILFTKDWKFAESGIFVKEYTKGQIEEVSDECAAAAEDDQAGEPFEGEESPEKKDTPPVVPAVTPATPTGVKKPASASPRVPASGKKKSIIAKAKQKLSQ